MSRRRLFVALRPPAEVCEALLDTMEGVAGARWQDADNLHITLRFIGEVDRHMYADILTALESVAMPPFPVEISGVGHFEGKRRSTAIWARVTPSPGLAQLQHRIEMACRLAGLPPETRKFVPHVTLARLNSGSAPIGEWLAAHGRLSCTPWLAESFALYESDLTPNGAIYREIHQFP
ncbi:RNA 2',3'-cyclic phosphodiesterase [Aurantiacibacter marinus]|uniref:RNA 2',3'-cyclic phosphodiesterase n=1 Tax=Aurantiacibacter marinus TaxID=874156 RepID=A0A0H0XNQ7_9SPHN|nr:RNA 2',3'-cyclic phosphodiesterase [Aurantiacibacter marinus]KLI63577.1 2'-5' RNA ligase [Aurantiacibacter marinus]